MKHLSSQIEKPLKKGVALRGWPANIELIVFDFDGVFTDNRVWLDQEGNESVVCNRSDGLGIELLRQYGIRCRVLSAEANPIVAARCRKLQIEFDLGIKDKVRSLQLYARKNHMNLRNIIYVGNDVNDLECMKKVGFAVAVADAHPRVLKSADLVLTREGGRGAVREFCDAVIERVERMNHV